MYHTLASIPGGAFIPNMYTLTYTMSVMARNGPEKVRMSPSSNTASSSTALNSKELSGEDVDTERSSCDTERPPPASKSAAAAAHDSSSHSWTPELMRLFSPDSRTVCKKR